MGTESTPDGLTAALAEIDRLNAALDRVETERDDARTRLQALVTVAELTRHGLASALTRAAAEDHAPDLIRDLQAAPPPLASAEDAVRVPLLRIPARVDIPTRSVPPMPTPNLPPDPAREEHIDDRHAFRPALQHQQGHQRGHQRGQG